METRFDEVWRRIDIKNTPLNDPRVQLGFGVAAAGLLTARFVKNYEYPLSAEKPDIFQKIYALGNGIATCAFAGTLGKVSYDLFTKRYDLVQQVNNRYGQAASIALLAPFVVRSVTTSHGKAVVFLREWVYDMAQYIAAPINTSLLYAITNFNPWSMQDFESNRNLAPGSLSVLTPNDLDLVKEKVLLGTAEKFDDESLMQLFDNLNPVNVDDMYKNWEIKIVNTGRLLSPVGTLMRSVFGMTWLQRFRSRLVGDPMVIGLLRTLYYPSPFAGNSSLQMVQFRNKVSACAITDHLPFMQYMRILHEGDDKGKRRVLLAVWTARGRIAGWMTLTEDKELNMTTARSLLVPPREPTAHIAPFYIGSTILFAWWLSQK